MTRFLRLSEADRQQIHNLITRIEARRFWRPLSTTEQALIDACHRRIAQSNSTQPGPLFPCAAPEPRHRTQRRPYRRHHL